MIRFENRLVSLRAALTKAGAEAFYVSGVPNVSYLTGTKGYDCAIYVTQKEAWIITDFRYREMAQSLTWLDFYETDTKHSTADFINSRPEKTIGLEKDRLTLSAFLNFKEKCPEKLRKCASQGQIWR